MAYYNQFTQFLLRDAEVVAEELDRLPELALEVRCGQGAEHARKVGR